MQPVIVGYNQQTSLKNARFSAPQAKQQLQCIAFCQVMLLQITTSLCILDQDLWPCSRFQWQVTLVHAEPTQYKPWFSAFKRDGGCNLGGMSSNRGGPGTPVHSHHPPLADASRLQVSTALPCLAGGGSASQFCLLPAQSSLQNIAVPNQLMKQTCISLEATDHLEAIRHAMSRT